MTTSDALSGDATVATGKKGALPPCSNNVHMVIIAVGTFF